MLKGIGGFYTVQQRDGMLVECKARGKFRREGITPLPGDYVTFARQKEGLALLKEIHPRKNALVRPAVANVDQLVIVVAAVAPKPDLLLVDKLLVQAARQSIETLLVVNKCDVAVPQLLDTLEVDYRSCCGLVQTSATTGTGMETLREKLAGRISCFAGQSAVGKSSLLNALLPGLNLPVGGLSKKTDRGRHTTRHAQLWPFEGGAIVDTPGFSLLDFDEQPLTQQELDACYPEFGDAPSRCRFVGCSHRSEPDCAVKKLLEEGKFSQDRYARYVTLAEQFIEMRKHQYD